MITDLDAWLEDWLKGCCTCRSMHSGIHAEVCPVRTISAGELVRLAYLIDDYVEVCIEDAIADFTEELKGASGEEVRVQHEESGGRGIGDGA